MERPTTVAATKRRDSVVVIRRSAAFICLNTEVRSSGSSVNIVFRSAIRCKAT